MPQVVPGRIDISGETRDVQTKVLHKALNNAGVRIVYRDGEEETLTVVRATMSEGLVVLTGGVERSIPIGKVASAFPLMGKREFYLAPIDPAPHPLHRVRVR